MKWFNVINVLFFLLHDKTLQECMYVQWIRFGMLACQCFVLNFFLSPGWKRSASGAEVVAEAETAEVTAPGPAHGLDLETGKGIGAAKRNVGPAGVTGRPVRAETGSGRETEMWTNMLKTAGRTNMSTDHLRRSLLWGTSTTARSPAPCSLAASSSWRAWGQEMADITDYF